MSPGYLFQPAVRACHFLRLKRRNPTTGEAFTTTPQKCGDRHNAKSPETVDSLDIGSFAKAGQPQEMPRAFGLSLSWGQVCRKGVVVSTIPLAVVVSIAPAPRCTPTDEGRFSLDEHPRKFLTASGPTGPPYTAPALVQQGLQPIPLKRQRLNPSRPCQEFRQGLSRISPSPGHSGRVCAGRWWPASRRIR